MPTVSSNASAEPVHDFYQILGLNKNASDSEINKSYKKLALKYHPQKDTAEESLKFFHLISEAYDILSDRKKKAVYDLFGFQGLLKGVEAEDGIDFEGNYNFPPEQGLKLFKSFFGTDNVHEASFAPGPGNKVKLKDAHVTKETDVIPIVKVTLEDLYNGRQLETSFTKKTFAPDGSVSKYEEKTFKLQTKPGWKNGTRVALPKEGNQLSNGFREDAVFLVEEVPHAEYKRIGDDLHTTKRISLKSALTETEVKIKALDDRVLSILISEVVSPEYVKAIEGEGMPKGQESSGNLTKGNLYIHFQIEFPQYLDSKQKKQISEALH